jgi:hypothetical protein
MERKIKITSEPCGAAIQSATAYTCLNLCLNASMLIATDLCLDADRSVLKSQVLGKYQL